MAVPTYRASGFSWIGAAQILRPSSREFRDAARTVGVVAVPMEVDNLNQIESAFAALANERVGAVVIAIGSVTFLHRERIAQLALEHRLPSMFPLREFVAAGGLMSYGESLFDFYRRAAF